jgi:hypothetical protein
MSYLLAEYLLIDLHQAMDDEPSFSLAVILVVLLQ